MHRYHKRKRKKWQWFQVKLHSRIPTDLKLQAGQSRYCCVRRKESPWPPHHSYFRRRHMLYFGAFTMGDLQRACLFAKRHDLWRDQSQNNWTMPAKRLTAGLARGTVSPYINMENVHSVNSLTVKVTSIAKQDQSSASDLILCRHCVSRLH